MLLEIRQLPVHVRPASFETLDSYVERVREANAIPQRTWNGWLKVHAPEDTKPTDEARVEIIEALTGLRPGHFEADRLSVPRHADGSECRRCTSGLSQRLACVRCTKGVRIAQIEHDGPRVCRRHMTWVGPGSDAGTQVVVTASILRADRLYRRLRKAGVLDAHRLMELMGCVDEWSRSAGESTLTAPELFRLAVSLADKMFRPRGVGHGPGDEARFEAIYSRFLGQVSALSAEHDVLVLADCVWSLLLTSRHRSVDDPHAFVVPQAEPNHGHEDALGLLRSSFYPRARHLHITQFVASERAASRFARYNLGGSRSSYVCPLGHRFESSPAHLRSSPRGTGCAVCANKIVLVGFNSLADTHPHLAALWHPTANGALRPEDVVAGSGHKAAWTCERGHTTFVSINSKAGRNIGCGFCANYLVDQTNSLVAVHPGVARTWHPTLHGTLTPADVVPGSNRCVWWICPLRGHVFQQPILRRVEGQGCPGCKKDATNHASVAALHPDIAKEWHPTRNGLLTAWDVLPGSGRNVAWRCRRGHVYVQQVVTRVKGAGCRTCRGKSVSRKNSMKATHPQLADEFHPTRNGSATPETIRANVNRRLWWRCAAEGHEWEANSWERAKNGYGCPYCSNRLVLTGWNDLATTHPDVAAEWDWALNLGLTPQNVSAGTHRQLYWRCAQGHSWRARGTNRRSGSGCPACYRGRRAVGVSGR